jgi:hypothetical protein
MSMAKELITIVTCTFASAGISGPGLAYFKSTSPLQNTALHESETQACCCLFMSTLVLGVVMKEMRLRCSDQEQDGDTVE